MTSGTLTAISRVVTVPEVTSLESDHRDHCIPVDIEPATAAVCSRMRQGNHPTHSRGTVMAKIEKKQKKGASKRSKGHRASKRSKGHRASKDTARKVSPGGRGAGSASTYLLPSDEMWSAAD
jgi:hypothetical protein